MKSLRDLFEFYEQPVNNITKYAELARNEKLPQNLAIMGKNLFTLLIKNIFRTTETFSSK